MVIDELSQSQCSEFLSRTPLGRLACCSGDQPYIVPLAFAHEEKYLYALATLGQKIEWMRTNPNVCVLFDEVASYSQWTSVVVNGTYQELAGARFEEERERGRKLLAHRDRWWQTPLAERQAKSDEQLIAPVFFRVEISSVSGLHAHA